MKKIILAINLFFLSQIVFGQVNSKLTSFTQEVFYTPQNQLSFIRLNESSNINQAGIAEFINSVILNNGANQVSVQKTEKDELGFTHIKFNVLQNGVLIANRVIIAHSKNGKLISLNGDLSDVSIADNSFSLSENNALNYALAKVNAKKYKWENKAEEVHMREALNDPSFSYSPDGIKVIFEKEGKLYKAYRFNIYAEEPLYRANVFVDASTGKILEEQNLICTTNVPASGATKYSGTQTITADYTGSVYRLRETQRGLGVETYNMHNGSSYLSVTDFTNSTANWTSTGIDQAATDAHWGAEKTYDYYFTQHNRNSVNNNGYKLLSYVHYMSNYTNAFWDGQRMTYGDGNGSSLKIFTALDVCGHEITHGMTSNTSGLNYSNESGALNESFSDIFGTSIENYARPTNWNWKIGEDLTNGGGGLRSMSNPNAYGDPDTYGGANYYTGTADNGGVHTNSGVSNFWYYLLTAGGSGTNDLSHTYSVTGIGFTSAAKIAFRALTVYFTPTTNFATARQLSIQAAKDLFGDCSNEVIQTTKAWYAVGVGADYIVGLVGPNFTSNITNFCSIPASANFNNTTANGLTYTWDFGDGTTSTATNTAHTYTAVGIYSVKLKALGCANVSDSVTKTSYIIVNGPVSNPVVSGAAICENASAIISGTGNATLKWYDSPTGGSELGSGTSFATPNLTTTTTFYAANTLTLAPVYGGMLTNTGGGYVNTNTNYQIFDVSQNGVLNSVVVYAQTVATRAIELRNSSNVVLNTTTVNLALGANTVILNYNLVPGTNYRLGLNTAYSSGLYRTTAGTAYPYNIASCVNITSSSAGMGTYYFFYNWQVSKEGCASARVPVVVTVNPLPIVTMSVPATPVCLSDQINMHGTPAGGTYAGGAMTGPVFNANNGLGTYTLSYMYTDANSCSDTTYATLLVQECTGISNAGMINNSILVYPNPAKDNLVINGNLSNSKIRVTDPSGRLMLMQDLTAAEETIKLDSLSNGIYIISIQDVSGKTLKTMKLVKE